MAVFNNFRLTTYEIFYVKQSRFGIKNGINNKIVVRLICYKKVNYTCDHSRTAQDYLRLCNEFNLKLKI